jgi:hypothetical protein
VVDTVVMVIVDGVPGVIAAGLNPNVAPVGNPLTPSVTEPLKPLIAVALTVYGVPLPCTTDALEGDPDREKSGFGDPSGTIWMPFKGARSCSSEVAPGIAESMNPVTFGMVNIT